VDPGIKINEEYIWDMLLKHESMFNMKHENMRWCPISCNFWRLLHFSAGQCTHWPIRLVRQLRYCSERFRLSLLQICELSTAPTLTLLTTMQDHLYRAKVQDVDDLKQHLIDVWDDLEQSVIDGSIDQWRSQLRARVYAEGGHFEQSL